MLVTLTDLDLRLIRVFVAVADAGGVSAAQATLNVSQPTISTQLATLETRVGFRLCERGRSGFRLTTKGERFYALAKKLYAAVDAFTGEARHMDKTLVGTLAIGLIGHTPISANARVSEAIARFRRRDEAVRFVISVRPPGDLEERLLSGDVQIAIGYFWHRVPALEYAPLFVERQLAYCGRGHPLFARAGRLAAARVAAFEWAWRTYPSPEVALSTTPANVTAHADNMEAIALLILSGHHLGYLPRHFAAPYVEQGLLKALNPATLCYDVTFDVVTRRGARRDPIVQAFLDDLTHAHRGGAAQA
ncbi:LysR family transcriptional regulator [Burkholderia pseudomallei]|uniref:LysR family transcriptional regulator n=1 Tax=Burkholderia pseudomallei TaxID=28450 RepID=UPI00052ABE0E|nr:LysR family transcriptional regulator [Burkholderia pseudomallei]AIV66761.1 bacterial regulatory helix-turn-helix, lysR family protein [Burkholderia pseudomallei K42]AIV86155.1 bacterial regulatory helix-turn-helix, lysR family protein [Burkholderia pseudomallei B03]AIV93095.1 bacterial regulatory helix-turn-helix, lysR family protein [Burkholderia pseudomallei A79A]KGW00133.1 bacterial regulatory helix-turn-helix, lysR family protein [Burkholderia pseudomallei ABCPW 30]KGW96061.1 bacterial